MNMTNVIEGAQDSVPRGRPTRASRAGRRAAPPPMELVSSAPIEVVSRGEWLPAEELHRKLSDAFEAGTRVLLDLEGVEHIDGGSLQLLVALSRGGPEVELLNASPRLRQWLDCAGATSLVECRPSPRGGRETSPEGAC